MDRVNEIIRILSRSYPEARIALNYKTPWQLLVAVVLSAQCTDKRVNMVTPALFKKYKDVQDYARANVKEFEQDIRSTGFYRNKAKNIVAAAQLAIKEFNCRVPDNMEDLLKLPGIARKSANIILFNAYDKIAGIAVDTHVRRLSQRLGLSRFDQPEKIEQDLMKIVPRKLWGKFSYLLIEHGRAICQARKPLCPQCGINRLCPSFKKFYPPARMPRINGGRGRRPGGAPAPR